MPMYEYQCKKCKHRFERIRKFSDAPLKRCPACGGALEQLLSASAVRFKGTGWYVTDYARKGASKPASGDGAEGKETKAGEKTETKPRHETAAAKPAEKEKKK
ncbi:MAG: FmdB family zinc ribbon protein [Terriglobales bacterium]